MNIHGGYKGSALDLIDLSVNTNSFMNLEAEKNLILENWNEINKYPEIDGAEARAEIAKYYGIDMENIILGNGATELIYLYAHYCKKKKVLLIAPTFSEYETALNMYGAEVYKYDFSADDFKYNWDNIFKYIKNQEIEAVFICNPNNPTATFIEDSEWKTILESLKLLRTELFVDESFIYFTNNKGIMEYIDRYNVFIMRSITKIFNIPGIRIGYGAGNKTIIAQLNKYKQPWTLNALALTFAKEYKNLMLKSKVDVEKIALEREYVSYELENIEKVKVYPSSSNYFLVKLEEGYDVDGLNDYLSKHKFFVRDCSSFKELNKQYFRFSIHNREINNAFIKALKSYLE